MKKRPNRNSSATHFWVATHQLRNSGLIQTALLQLIADKSMQVKTPPSPRHTCCRRPRPGRSHTACSRPCHLTGPSVAAAGRRADGQHAGSWKKKDIWWRFFGPHQALVAVVSPDHPLAVAASCFWVAGVSSRQRSQLVAGTGCKEHTSKQWIQVLLKLLV